MKKDKLFSKRMEQKKCPVCGRKLKLVKDPIVKKYTGYLWKCEKCAPNQVISIG